jgi:DmsE family decaheme c-type cytochrome
MKTLMLLGFLLWSVTSFAVVASQDRTPVAAPPQTGAEQKPPPPEKKVNRFAIEEEDEEPEPDLTKLLGQYSGTPACTKCHEKEARVYRASPHGNAADAGSPAADHGCETCHGPGKIHDVRPALMRMVRSFKGSDAAVDSEVCTQCHNSGAHAGWDGSQHEGRNVTCVSCHSHHAPKSETGMLKEATATATCARCHPQPAAKMRRASHMPVAEGKMECSSCHNPHGSANVRMLRDGQTINESCLSCHAEKRGPFLWEHKPVTEGCTVCHDAHGSSNDRMLKAKSPMLCQRCHIATRHPATPYDGVSLLSGSNRLINRACGNCHPTIHGSNHPSGVFFMR